MEGESLNQTREDQRVPSMEEGQQVEHVRGRLLNKSRLLICC